MAKEEQDSKRKNLSTDFNKKFGTINATHFYRAQEAIRNGGDVSITSDRMTSENTVIHGLEIKEWGLDVDSLLVSNEVEPYEREIL